MGVGYVTIGRRPYACGLYWENSPSGRITQAAKEAARQPGHQADFYAVRAAGKDGRVPQFGLSHGSRDPAIGHRAGMPVLAACLANQQPGSWAGAFRFREGTAIVVVRDDLIVPDGDQFFVDETEARDRLLQEMALGGLQKVYAPESWGLPSADTMPVSLLLNDRADVRLRAVALSRSAVVALAAIGGVLLVGVAIGYYLQQKEAQELAQKLALQRLADMAKNRQPVYQASPEYPPPERRWEKEPRAMDLIEACRQTLAQVPAGIAGWSMASARCDKGALTTKWQRSGGFSMPPPRFILSPTGTEATFTVSLAGLAARGAETLQDPEVTTRRYLAQNWPGALATAQDDPQPQAPPGYQGVWNPPLAPWVKRSFTVAVPALPWATPVFFRDVPGLIVNALSLGSGSGTGSWTVEGVIYENRR